MINDDEVKFIQAEIKERLRDITDKYNLKVQVIAWTRDEDINKEDVIFSGNCCIVCAQKRLNDYIEKYNVQHTFKEVIH